MAKFCENHGKKLVDGKCEDCTQKSTSAITTENLEKAVSTLEALAKGVRPSVASEGAKDKRTSAEAQKDVVEEEEEFAKKRSKEGGEVEGPKSKKITESEYKSWGREDEDEDEDEDGGDHDYDEDDEEAEDGDEDRDQFRRKSTKKDKAKKSLSESMNESHRSTLDVTDFLRDLVDQTSKSIEGLDSQIRKSHRFEKYQENFNMGLASAILEVGTLVKSLTEAYAELAKSPAGQRKSELTSTPIEKSFVHTSGDSKQNLSKSEAAMRIHELMKSATTQEERARFTSAAIRCESTGEIPADIKEKLNIA